jgi:hypothetical protein
MRSLSLLRQIDRPWLAALGLLGACGPEPVAMTGTGSTSGDVITGGDTSTSGSTSMPTTGPVTGSTTGPVTESTTGSTTEPTIDPTTTTTGPAPECVNDFECTCGCYNGRCESCHLGDCFMDEDCDRGYVCSLEYCVPGPECYSDDDCPGESICGFAYCTGELTQTKLPICPAGRVDVSQWNLTQTPSALGLGDLDGDGDLDIFAALPAVAAIELALNDGAGTFTPGGLIDVGPPQSDMRVAAGDFDGDMQVDLAVARADSSDLVVLFGLGGVFTPGPILPASAPPRTITALDINGDGDDDLATIGGNFDSVSVWVGDGVGGFAPEAVFADLTDSVASTIQLIHDNEDEAALFALPAPGAPENLRSYRGTPGVTWKLESTSSLDAPMWTQALAGDLGNLSGYWGPELVALRVVDGGGLARVWLGDANFHWLWPRIYLTVSPLQGGVFVGGFVQDLVAATGGPTVSVLLGDGGGGFKCERIHDVPLASSPEVLAAGELDGDEGAEFVVGSRDGPLVMVFRAL